MEQIYILNNKRSYQYYIALGIQEGELQLMPERLSNIPRPQSVPTIQL